MLKMELAEVVNPNFAVPVFGVVLCAVLVFAFGFKSSVQPPSFDFDEEKRLKRRKAKKAQTNGHIPSISNAVATVAKQPVSGSKSATTSKAQSSKSDESLQAKLRSKKTASSPKPTPAKQEVVKATEPVDDVDGWTTAISKKVKKRRNKEQPDDVSKYDHQDQELSGGETKTDDVQEAIPAPSTNEEEVVAESPKGQRKKKDKKQKPVKETKTEADTETEPPKTPEAPEPEQDKEIGHIAPVVIEVEKPREIETVEEIQVQEEETIEADVTDTPTEVEPPKRSPKKVRSKKDKVAAAPTIEEPTILSSLSVKDDDKSSDKKSKKSPKKKKKGAVQEVSEREEKPSVSQLEESTSHISTSDVTDLSPSKTVPETVSKGAAHDTESNQPENVVESNSTAEEVCKPQPSSPPVSFDELGAEDWIEAKPQKKKKKTRREN